MVCDGAPGIHPWGPGQLLQFIFMCLMLQEQSSGMDEANSNKESATGQLQGSRQARGYGCHGLNEQAIKGEMDSTLHDTPLCT